ncbi:hypothetical protein AA0114_g999 [Alternaria tenuissima]|uniref:Uncharacterized protein n=1 Tax=Alternaria tenuissima TaxID=119927 RepID=A0A4Q4MVT2_9PLEO|nr:hypothetical protein AA0114_g999 [Alternaria tenuissima]
MVVLPNIFYAPNALRPRTATGNSLGGGAIAGIVLGSLCGLLVLLVIFWTCRLGNSAFTKAKSFSTSAVDKAEKGHACAKDLYSAGRDRHFQSSKVQDKAHYKEHNPEHQRGLDYLYPVAPHSIDVRLPHSEHRTTPAVPCSIRTPPTISAVPSTCNLSYPPPLPHSLSSADTKPIVLDTKRVLGIDDASYLDEIPFHGRKDSNLTVAPACVASSSKKSIPQSGDSSAGRRILNKLSSLSSESDVPGEIDTTYMGTEIKYRRISELSGSETVPSPKESTTGYYNADLNSIFPISEVSPESVPTDLYLRPFSPQAAIDRFQMTDFQHEFTYLGNTSDEYTVNTPTIPANTSLKIDSTNTVDPWKVEYQPNPVIFPHLSASVDNMQYQDKEEDTLLTTSLTSPPRLGSMIKVCGASFDSFESPSPMRAPSTIPELEVTPSQIQRINTEFSEISVPTLKSSTSDLSVDDASPVTTTSEVPPRYESQSPYLSELGTVEVINFAATISSKWSPDDSDTSFTVLSSPRSLTIANSNAMTLSSQASSRTSPVSNLSALKTTTSSSKLTEVDTDPVYPCSICHLKFRTPGLRRYVAFNHKRDSVLKHLCLPKLL